MSLCQFDSNGQYLEKALIFLKKYQWIYNYRNTDILSKRILSNFSKEWIGYFNSLSVDDLHDLARGHVSECAPFDLKLLINEINSLNLNLNTNTLETEKQSSAKMSGLSEKKTHEIGFLAPVINEICQETGSDLIVDIGSGMGYLPHLLCEKYGYSVLALEVSKKLICTALTNQDTLHPDSKGRVVFSEMFVGESSAADIEKLVALYFDADKKICLTGLHACADLSVEALQLFTNFKNANSLVMMPCCYHRMAVLNEEDGIQHFKNFPSSLMVRQLFDKNEMYQFIGQPFLRLACQETIESFVNKSHEMHQKHAQQCLQRAILQLVAEIENCSVRRLKRKSGKSNATDSDEGFQDYLNNLGKTHELIGRSSEKQIKITDEAFLGKMHEKWTKYKSDCWLVEVLMGLQAAIQSICENVILLDRVEFLKEKGIHCYNRKITNDSISPRCWALIAKKNI